MQRESPTRARLSEKPAFRNYPAVAIKPTLRVSAVFRAVAKYKVKQKGSREMDYGLEFLKLAHDAIKRQEEELGQLESSKHSNVATVRQCEEAWQKYFILKHAIRMRFRPKLYSELRCGKNNKRSVDLYFVDGRERTLAVFELKPGSPSPYLAKGIVRDCEKLRDLSDVHSETQKYVVGIVCGSSQDIDVWEGTLTATLQKADVTVHRVTAPADITSNEGNVIRFVMFRVTAVAAMRAGA
jgi:hypothetical protein